MKRTKNLIMVLMVVLLALGLTACGEKTVNITIPEKMVGDTTIEELQETHKEDEGVKEIKQGENGEIIMVVTETKQQEMLADYKRSIDESISNIVNEEEPIFTSIEYNENLTQIDMYYNQENGNMFAGIICYAYTSLGADYQILNGLEFDEIDCVVRMIDDKTGEELETYSYKKILEEAEAEEESEE